MKRIFRRVDRWLGHIEDWSLFTAVVLALVAAMVNIVLRKTTSYSLYWSDEVVRKVIFFTTFMGASAAIRRRSLIRIDAFPQLFPLFQKPLTILSHVSVMVFAAVMTWLGYGMAQIAYRDAFAKTSTLQIPEWYFYAVLPLVGVMMFVRTTMQLIEEWNNASPQTDGDDKQTEEGR